MLKNLRSYRKAAGYKQRHLAEAAGVSVSMISYIESGKRRASLPIALRLAARLGTTVEALCGEGAEDVAA